MDALAKQAVDLFDSSSICQGIPNPHLLLNITNIYDIYEHSSHQVKSTELEGWFEEFNSKFMVQLVAIPIDEDRKLPIDAGVFKRLITQRLKVDPCVLWFIARNYDGFHRIDNATSISYIMATSMYMLVWNFDRQRGSTAGVLFDRRPLGFSQFVPDQLSYFVSYARSPGMLAFVICHATCEWQDANTDNRQLPMVHHLEKVTAFGPDGNDVPFNRHKTEEIMSWLKMIADIHINLSNKLRTTSMISAVTKDILDTNKESQDSIPTRESSGGNNIISAVHLLTGRIKAYENYVMYLKERADRLSSVTFALLTHEDAAISVDIAKSSQRLAEQSTYIAEQAKRDSSAMKTITIITMAFLPATFFATLFALPTLDWEGTSIVTSKFWIYWAFTLPTTALVFLLWALLTNRTQIVAPFLNLFNEK
ncbi:hypothetical protein F4859DRAFT_500275 [Xylaria cf. heliscus]|nr:hypothetical protein F4859DRAFT_500275 [Xylaria cf. heliscus]